VEEAKMRECGQSNPVCDGMRARIMSLERALLLMFSSYEGVYDMRDPPRQSDVAKRAEGLARDALAENVFVK
jgi:hypothetical protein